MASFETSDEQVISYEYTEGSHVVVLVHGYLHSKSVWREEVEFFQDKGYGTLCFDLRGHGSSSKPQDVDSYSMSRFSADLEELLQHLSIADFSLIGHSLGGMISLFHYDKYGSCKRLVLLDSSYENPAKHIPVAKDIDWNPIIDKLIKYFEKNQHLLPPVDEVDFSRGSKLIPSWLRVVKNNAPQTILACMREILDFNIEHILDDIRVPTLIIVGEKDWQTPPSISKKMHERIKGSEYHVLRDADHDLILSESEEYSMLIYDFFIRTE